MVRGILDYRQHTEHWRIAGVGSEPFAFLQDALNTGEVNGVICPMQNPLAANRLKKLGIPFVTVSAALPDMDLPRVTTDFSAVGKLGGEYLLSRGFTQYGFVGLDGVWSSRQTLAGFLEVVEQYAGRTCHATETRWVRTPEQQVVLRDWLESLPKPIGIMAFVDVLGRAVIDMAAELGLRVPDDVAVLGVTNDRWATELAEPPMSSIRLDQRTIGYQAAKVLDAMMAGEAPPAPQWIPPVCVLTRRSTEISLAEDPIVSQALHFIRDHCLEEITVEDVLNEVKISRRSLEKRMKAAIGVTPQVAITRTRIERAKRLLIDSDMTIGEISRMCAFTYQQGFVVVFKRLVGVTPGQYRRQRGR